jgi:hypothetical protein
MNRGGGAGAATLRPSGLVTSCHDMVDMDMFPAAMIAIAQPQNNGLNNKALKDVGCIWYAPFVIENKSLLRRHSAGAFAKAPQPFRPGGSSQFQYYPHLLALSNPKNSLGSCPKSKANTGALCSQGGE